MYCKVITTFPIDKEFIYKCPKGLIVKRGNVVSVPFGKRKDELGLVTSVFLENQRVKSIRNLKDINAVINELLLNEKMIEFVQWVSDYNLVSQGAVIKMVLLNKNVINYNYKFNKLNHHKTKSKPVILNDEQNRAYDTIKLFLRSKSKIIVLEGVTGSGKTEVYFKIIEDILISNKQILILLPEISLTPQIEKRFLKCFGFDPDVWHSKVSESKKRKTWHKCYSGETKIIIGARSSLFLPYKNLGLIIVDEEHDISYKQEDGVRYHARDMAIVRSTLEKIPIILSTATPSVETYHNTQSKKYKHVFLSKQYSGLELPKINLINLKDEKLEKNKWISKKILVAISECIKRNEQSLIFLNRRGYSPFTVCGSCGYRYQCTQCTSWLVMHAKKNLLVCHHCGFTKTLQDKCPDCNLEHSFKFIGPGIERVAEELKCEFPESKIEMISSDNANTLLKISQMIERIESKEIEILVGTQIIAKGYHFPSLSLVGVLDADAGLIGGDLRASENTYNLLQQVSGRAGRSKGVGKVYVQTYFHDNNLIRSLKDRNRENFVKQLLMERKRFQLPPFGHLIAIILSGSSKSDLLKFAKTIVKKTSTKDSISMLGPVEAPLFLLRGRYRYRFLVRGNESRKLNIFTKNLLNDIEVPRNIRVTIDVNPYSFT